VRRGVLALTLSSLLVTLCPSGAVASGGTTGVITDLLAAPRMVRDTDFPDPGFSKLGKSFYLFKTGRGFKNTTSANPKGPYGELKTSMLPEHEPPWAGDSGASPRWRAWAPNVFAVKIRGNWRYVMYFTAWHTTKKTNCVGVAMSASPRVGYKFVPGSTICSPWAGAPYHYEAIDPTHYRAVDGTRYLIYKTSDHNRKHWQIRAVRMNKYGTLPVSPKADRAKTTRTEITAPMESPSILRHNRKVWMFTSRSWWNNGCEYHTDVWQADNFWDGKFRFVKNLLTTETTGGLCGPGGAQVIQSGRRTFIAFHAWKDIAHTDHARRAYVGELGWDDTGAPFLRGIQLLPPLGLP